MKIRNAVRRATVMALKIVIVMVIGGICFATLAAAIAMWG